MKSAIGSPHAKSATLGLLVTRLARATAFARGLRKVGVAALAVCLYATLDGFAVPAQARCVIAGQMRYDIPNHLCMEAQQTGCVQSLLTPQQYANCLQANAAARARGEQCMINGMLRLDLSPQQCEVARSIGAPAWPNPAPLPPSPSVPPPQPPPFAGPPRAAPGPTPYPPGPPIPQPRSTDSLCSGYAQQAVSDFRNNRDRPRCLRVMLQDRRRWSEDFNGHYYWCTTVPPSQRMNEIKMRSDLLNNCRGGGTL
jgi:hypothetical protein